MTSGHPPLARPFLSSAMAAWASAAAADATILGDLSDPPPEGTQFISRRRSSYIFLFVPRRNERANVCHTGYARVHASASHVTVTDTSI